jgi:hypothetical protein
MWSGQHAPGGKAAGAIRGHKSSLHRSPGSSPTCEAGQPPVLRVVAPIALQATVMSARTQFLALFVAALSAAALLSFSFLLLRRSLKASGERRNVSRPRKSQPLQPPTFKFSARHSAGRCLYGVTTIRACAYDQKGGRRSPGPPAIGAGHISWLTSTSPDCKATRSRIMRTTSVSSAAGAGRLR